MISTCKWAALATLMVLAAAPCPAPAQDCTDYSRTFHWESLLVLDEELDASSLAIDGDRAVVTTYEPWISKQPQRASGGLLVVDLSERDGGKVVAKLDTPGLARRVQLSGDYAFVADGAAGVQVVSLKRSGRPEIVATIPALDSVNDVLLDEKRLYVADAEAGLRLYDVENPRRPIAVWTLDTPGTATDVEVYGDYVLLADRSGGTHFIDVSDLESPTIVTTIEDARGMFVSVAGDVAYVPISLWVGPPEYWDRGTRLYDIRDPRNPILLSRIEELQAQDALVQEDVAYLSVSGGIHLFNIADPTDPLYLGEVRGRGNLGSGATLVGQRIFTVCSAGLQVFGGVGYPRAQLSWRSDLTNADMWDVFVDGHSLYASAGEFPGYVSRWDITESHAPVRITSSGFPGWSRSMVAEREHLFVADVENGLHVYDITGSSLIRIKTIQTPAGCWDVTAHGDYLYVGGQEDGLHILRAFGEGALEDLMTVNFPRAGEVATSGDRGFVKVDHELVEMDISDPEAPVVVGSTELPPGDANYWGLVLSGDYAYMVRNYFYTGSLVVIDISIPGRPVVVSQAVVSGGRASDIQTLGDYAYVSTLGFDIFDVSEPAQPRIVGGINHPFGYTNGIALAETAVYAANEFHGLLQAPLQCASVPDLVIDIVVGSDDSHVDLSCDSHGVIPVAVLTTDEFDARTIDHRTVTFGPGRAGEAHQSRHGVIRHEEDVDGDGDIDLRFHFRGDECALSCGATTEAVLRGETLDGQSFEGVVSLRVRSDAPNGERPSPLLVVSPNPFNPTTEIRFETRSNDRVELVIYDLSGRRVRSLRSETLPAGRHSVVWKGRDDAGVRVASGVYLCRIQIGEFAQTKRLVLLK